MKSRLSVPAAFVILVAVAVASATAAKSAKAPQLAGPNQTVTIAVGVEPTSFDPHAKSDDGLNYVIWQVWEQLTVIKNGKVTPLLAASLPATVNSRTSLGK